MGGAATAMSARHLVRGFLQRLALWAGRIALPQRRFGDSRVARRPIRGTIRYALNERDVDDIAAFSMALEGVVDAVGADAVVVLSSTFGEQPRVAIDRGDFDRLLSGLANQPEPFYVSFTESGGPGAVLARVASLQPQPGDQLTVFLGIYDSSSGRAYGEEHGTLVEIHEKAALRSHDDPVEVYGVPLRTTSAGHRREPFEVAFPIDAVFMWVDGSDPEWQARRTERLRDLGSLDRTDHVLGRYLQHDELRYSLRSVHRNAPWIRRLFLVTDQQVPDWLSPESNLSVVDHRDILPESALPTFNSHAIACGLHRIPDLSDHFIVFNDDIFVGRPLRPERLIMGNGVTKFFLSRTPLPVDSMTIHDEARGYTADLIENVAGFRPTNVFKHTPIAFNRSLLEALVAELPDEYERTMHAPFRSPDDIVVEYLHHYLGYARRSSVPGEITYGYFGFGSEAGMTALRRYRRSKPMEVFCVNDVTGTGAHDPALAADLRAMLAAEFPHPSPYEADP